MENLINQKGKQNMKNLINYLNIAQITAGKTDIRYYLNGVLIERENQNMKLVATDGHRMTVINMGEDRGDTTNCIIENETINAINAYKRESIRLNLENGSANFTINRNRINLNTKGIDGKFPDWQRVLKDHDADSLGYNIKNVKSDLELLKSLSKGEKYVQILIAIVDNNVVFYLGKELLPEGIPYSLVNAAYIIDVLKQFQMLNKINNTNEMLVKIPKEKGNTINFHLGNITSIVMPIRI